MSKKTKAVEEKPAMTEQAPREITINAKIERVEFAPVDKMESLAKSGFCTERILVPEIAVPLFRLCCEVLSEDDQHKIEDLPVPVTPFMTADQLADLIQGATLLHPMIVNVVKSRHPKGEEKSQEVE